MTPRSPGGLMVASTTATDDHLTGEGHPERPERLVAVEAGLLDTHLPIELLPPRRAEAHELERVHSSSHLRALEDFVARGGGNLDPDTPTSAGSWTSAVHGAGATLAAVDALREGHGAAAFVVCRPPGHHATADRAMGFCLLNNVAIAAGVLRAQGERVLILDWDVHHGNGTQAIFWDDPDVLTISMHEWPAYPGTGRAEEIGGPGASGLNVNIPLPAGATGDIAVRALDEVAAPVIEDFAPTWVLISAGFDAHRDDPLGGLAWSAGDYAVLTARAVAFAPAAGRVVAVLEGGYDLAALRRSVAATAAALVGIDTRPEALTAGGPGDDAITGAIDARRRAREEHG